MSVVDKAFTDIVNINIIENTVDNMVKFYANNVKNFNLLELKKSFIIENNPQNEEIDIIIGEQKILQKNILKIHEEVEKMYKLFLKYDPKNIKSEQDEINYIK